MFLEQPRQTGKSISTICYYLWQFLFFGRNAKMLFLNKKLDDSKLNLQRLKDIRAALPDYLQLDAVYNKDGTKKKGSNQAVTLTNAINNNVINTAPSARNKMMANSLGRGMTVQFIWYDEYGFIPYNYVIYQAAAPAFSRASKNAKEHGANYGILITTTPGDMLSPEGKEAYETKEMATKFSEMWYDMTPKELEELKTSNPKSNFIYIRYTYRELGYTDAYFDEMVKTLKSDWPSIRREVLLEWSESAENSPFDKADLDTVKSMIKRPIRQMWVGKPIYVFDVYKDGLFFKYPPIIGVDVAAGLSQDSSAITIIDTETTEVLATFNNNSISPTELAKLIYILVKKYMPNAVVNIERDGIGNSVVTTLVRDYPDIKKNLFWEIKNRTFEEKYDEKGRIVRNTRPVKVYGINESAVRKILTEEILFDRMRYHKDKFHAEVIYTQLSQLERKKNGRIEHTSNGHDDQIFSYLVAMYVWYYGQNLMQNWHIKKVELNTDEQIDLDKEILGGEESLVNIGAELATDEEVAQLVKDQMTELASVEYMTHGQFLAKQEQDSEKALQKLLYENPLAREAYNRKYHETVDIDMMDMGTTSLINSINDFYKDSDEIETSELQHKFDNIKQLR